MRELKFRAWDGRTLSRPFSTRELKAEVWFEGEPEEEVCVSVPDCALTLDCDDLLLEQYTGLKDRNGREIYEGDILRDTHYHRPIVVEYLGAGFWCNESDDPGWCNLTMPTVEFREVIGNIHSNPDLLASR